jgi:hypothetical protein
MTQRITVSIRSFIVLATLVAGMSAAAALDSGKTRRLDMTVGPPGAEQSFGKFGAYMDRLKGSGQTCSFGDYEYGMSIACGEKNAEPRVYIHVEYQPTHGPDIAHVSEIRANGRNGGYLPVADHVKFLKDFAPARVMKRSR